MHYSFPFSLQHCFYPVRDQNVLCVSNKSSRFQSPSQTFIIKIKYPSLLCQQTDTVSRLEVGKNIAGEDVTNDYFFVYSLAEWNKKSFRMKTATRTEEKGE